MSETCSRCRGRGGWFVIDPPVHEPPTVLLRAGHRDCLLCYANGDVGAAVHQLCPACRHAPAGETAAAVELWAAQVGFRWPEPAWGRAEPKAASGTISAR